MDLLYPDLLCGKSLMAKSRCFQEAGYKRMISESRSDASMMDTGQLNAPNRAHTDTFCTCGPGSRFPTVFLLAPHMYYQGHPSLPIVKVSVQERLRESVKDPSLLDPPGVAPLGSEPLCGNSSQGPLTREKHRDHTGVRTHSR